MEIIKSAGNREKFNKDKLCGSLEKAGAPADLAKKVCDLTERNISPGESTAKIFRTALDYLVKEDLNLAASYGLRRAIGEFGPAGFLFEQYVEIILQTYGYETKRNVMMRGACVEHEVDVSAKKDGAHYIVEAKYRNEPGIKTHIDVVMYGDARMADIARFEESAGREKDIQSHILWLFTNTKFTEKAVTYAKCRNIRLTGWNYPVGKSLENLILDKKIYPITVLPSIGRFNLGRFAKKGLLLARDLLPYSAQDFNREFGLPAKDAEKISAENFAIAKMINKNVPLN